MSSNIITINGDWREYNIPDSNMTEVLECLNRNGSHSGIILCKCGYEETIDTPPDESWVCPVSGCNRQNQFTFTETVLLRGRETINNNMKVSFDNVEFQLMANGDLNVTVSWNGEMATLSRSVIISSTKNKVTMGGTFRQLIQLLGEAELLSREKHYQ